jgi:hypothetical protein
MICVNYLNLWVHIPVIRVVLYEALWRYKESRKYDNDPTIKGPNKIQVLCWRKLRKEKHYLICLTRMFQVTTEMPHQNPEENEMTQLTDSHGKYTAFLKSKLLNIQIICQDLQWSHQIFYHHLSRKFLLKFIIDIST